MYLPCLRYVFRVLYDISISGFLPSSLSCEEAQVWDSAQAPLARKSKAVNVCG